ncbi:MAG: histidine--tRNA ligase [Candidatus Dormibacter sp.]|uniref:histidine--tRNA ligase n=1 Tax=Candidatus Dormibacter sp. TaxID=2973982 RepID=UPI0026A9716C
MSRSQPIRAARGMRDILPEQVALWRGVEMAGEAAARSYGYQEIEVPIIEPVALIERVGGDTDVVRKEIYRIQSHGDASGEREGHLALRPEATAGVVRAYFQGGLNQLSQPVRLTTSGPMFRHDRPQAGRYRQFYQFDLEVIGDPSPAYDAEVIEVSRQWLSSLGLAGVSLVLNSIGDGRCRPPYLQRLKEYYRPLKTRLHPDCQRRLEENPLRLLDCKEEQCQPFKAAAPRITDHLCQPCAEAFAEVRSLLDGAAIEYRLDAHLVRGLDYYTRTVFEFEHAALGGAQNALGGGGRYDGLAAALGYPDTPAVGFAGGIDRVVLASPLSEPVKPAQVWVLPAEPGLEAEAARVGRLCRAEIPAVVDFSRRSLSAKMRAAGRAGSRWVAIMAADEAQRQAVQLRDMRSGDQREVPWDQLAVVMAGSLSS